MLQNHKLLVIGTTSNYSAIEAMELAPFFSFKFGLPFLTKATEFLTVAKVIVLWFCGSVFVCMFRCV